MLQKMTGEAKDYEKIPIATSSFWICTVLYTYLQKGEHQWTLKTPLK
jgi:hypothetical protein